MAIHFPLPPRFIICNNAIAPIIMARGPKQLDQIGSASMYNISAKILRTRLVIASPFWELLAFSVDVLIPPVSVMLLLVWESCCAIPCELASVALVGFCRIAYITMTAITITTTAGTKHITSSIGLSVTLFHSFCFLMLYSDVCSIPGVSGQDDCSMFSDMLLTTPFRAVSALFESKSAL
jgi:hypothetical protein